MTGHPSRTRAREDATRRRKMLVGTLAVLGGLCLLASLSFAGGASATAGGTIPLHNNTAQQGQDCPAGGPYWHFVLAPNDGTSAFVSITLNLGTETVVFSGAQIIPNGSQTDNVFVAVPSGHLLTDLVLSGSFATYSGATPTEFNLSHICAGGGGTTTTTAESTTTTVPETTTTVPETTTTVPETTTTVPETTTTVPETTTTTAESTTTTVAETTTSASVLGTTLVQQSTSSTPGASVLGEQQTALPRTGADLTLPAALGALLIGGGVALMLAGRRVRSAR